jgi:hypothetical protein
MGVQLARHSGFPSSDPAEKATTTRPSSTANFLVDSTDRDDKAYPNSGDFQITKASSLFNGFFNRMAVQEIVLDWGIPNVSTADENDTFDFIYDDGTGPVTDSVTLPTGFYTAAQVLNALVGQMNVSVGTPGAFVIDSGNTGVYMSVDQTVVAGGTFEILDGNLAGQIFTAGQIDAGQAQSYPIICPRILNYRYLDFISPQLTYNQELKDNDTSPNAKDVLYRWYFGWDNETSYDTLGFPILQGYRSFVARRLISYPKQIRWNTNQPIGNISFQVYDQDDQIVDAEPPLFPAVDGGAVMEFQMTLLLSED